MLNQDLLTKEERNHLDRLYVLWQNFKKITSDLENEKSWLEYDESHYSEELHKEQKRIIDRTLEMIRPATQNAWWRYSHEWDRLDKKYS